MDTHTVMNPAIPGGEGVRILHAVGSMERAGIETWLMHLMRRIDRDRYQFDFVVDEGGEGDYDAEIRKLGGEVLPIVSRRNTSFTTRLRELIKVRGGYDVVHSHLNLFNARVMKAAANENVPVRISHSHTDRTDVMKNASLSRRIANRWFRRSMSKSMTVGLAASDPALRSLFGSSGRHDPRCHVLHCGMDFEPFQRLAISKDASGLRQSIRAELGIPIDAWLLGHVGRFVDVKNHSMMLEVLSRLSNHVDDAHLLLVGSGPLRAAVEARAVELNLVDRLHFAGSRDDVPALLVHAMDAFIFPSRLEGLGIALVEAQAAGLPCVVSDRVPVEADVIDDLITRLPVSPDGGELHEKWAMALVGTRRKRRNQAGACDRVLASPFAIENGLRQLMDIYNGDCPKVSQ